MEKSTIPAWRAGDRWAEILRIERRVSLILLGIQVLVLAATGIVLLSYWSTGEHDHRDMTYLQFDLPFGMIMRKLHRAATETAVLTSGVHAMWLLAIWLLGRGGPRFGRHWVIRLAFLGLLIFFVIIGHFLPWDALSAVAFKPEVPSAPITGSRYDARSFLVAGRVIGETAIRHLYFLHGVFVPITALVVGAVFYFWREHRDE